VPRENGAEKRNATSFDFSPVLPIPVSRESDSDREYGDSDADRNRTSVELQPPQQWHIR
jgi:hypothetical protein